jgi:predicted ATPase/DNA-binding SARP family transcriptional activator
VPSAVAPESVIALEPAAAAGSAELPAHLTPFVGRDHELGDLIELVPSARLLTLTGAGGSGKTRLARETAARVAGAYGRVAWVDLASIDDAALIDQQVAAALHLAERADATPNEIIVAAICEVRTLLVLDNCEHLVEACAELADSLLRACPRLTILATSREALGVASETAWLVPPLSIAEAVELFADRARSALPTFGVCDANARTIAEICQRLDGIPLAIELAAARVRVLSPAQIAQRLDDAFRLLTSGSRTALPRHRTLRATMEWSYGLLGTREQVLLRRLAVFAGSFSLDAAEAVCVGDPLDAEDILDGVTGLVDRSLITMIAGDGIARYRMLETVRQYGVERLREAGEAEQVEERHARYFLGVIEAAAPLLFGGEHEAGLLTRLAADNDNLRAATAWTVRTEGHGDLALRFASGLFWYWYGSTMGFGAGLFREGRRFIREALAKTQRAGGDPALRGHALASLGLVGLAQGDYQDATIAFDESLALLRTHGDQASVIFVLTKYSATRLMLGEIDPAWAMLEEAYAAVEPIRPYSMLHSFVYSWRGLAARARGEFAEARRMHEANLRVGAIMKHRTVIGHGHAFLGGVALQDGNPDEAFTHFCEALPYHLDLGDGWGVALDIEGLSACAAHRGRHADAARLMGAVDALRERSAVALPATDAADRARRTELAREKLRGDFDRLYREGRGLAMEEVVRLGTDASVVHTSEHRIPTAVLSGNATDTTAGGGLRVLALGPLQVFVDGNAVDTSAWGSARPRELLVYLLMHPEGRTKEQVGLAFWPDASTAQMRNSFHVTLHRLRKALGGSNWVTLTGDRYRIDATLVRDLDVAEFEREVTAALRELRSVRDGAAATGRLDRALARYRGDFLDGEPVGDWHIQYRDRFQQMYVGALMELGRRYSADERHVKAAEAFRRVLARDELHEEALRALMRALDQSGERSLALRTYQRFATRLREELDAEPEEDTMRLLARLQSSGD